MKKLIQSIAFLLAAALSLSLYACGAKKQIAMTYNYTEISEGMYSYWLSVYKTNFVYNYAGGEDSEDFWAVTLDEGGKTYADYAEEEIIRTIKYFTVGVDLFRQYGLTIDKSVSESIDEDIQEKLEYVGSRSALNTELAEFGLNIDGLKDVYIAEEKWQAVYDYLYGESGIEKVSDTKIDEYYRENYSLVKLIAFYTENKAQTNEDGTYVYDSDGNVVSVALTDEEKLQKQQDIETALGALQNGEDFATLSEKYSDEDLSYYQSGCFICADSIEVYGPALTAKAAEMAVGEIARVDDTGITFIAVKCELPSFSNLQSYESEQIADLEDKVIELAYKEKFASLAEEVSVNEEIIAAHPIETAPLNVYY